MALKEKLCSVGIMAFWMMTEVESLIRGVITMLIEVLRLQHVLASKSLVPVNHCSESRHPFPYHFRMSGLGVQGNSQCNLP